MVLHIQAALRSGQTPYDICQPRGIDFKEADGKVLFNYDMIASYHCKSDPIVKECRGLILYSDNWDVASYGFERFFNYGEDGADSLPEDLSKCRVLPKLDGTMISLWCDRTDGGWKVSTRGMIYAEGKVGTLSDKTFAQLFWETFLYDPDTCLPTFNKYRTYIFELTSPFNRIVTHYPENKVTLLTVRSNQTLDEMPYIECFSIAGQHGLDIVRPVNVTNWQELLKMQGLDTLDEGFVVVAESKEGSHRRVKVKNPAYLSVAKIITACTEKNFLELLQTGKGDDFLAYFSEYRGNFDKLLLGLRKLEHLVKEDYLDIQHLTDRKSFAKCALEKNFPSLMFQMRDGKITNLATDLLLMRTTQLLELIHTAERIYAQIEETKDSITV